MSPVEVPVAATGLLKTFAVAEMIHPVDFHLARRMSQIIGSELDETVYLAMALCVRELRSGSVCLDLQTAHQLLPITKIDDGSAEPVNLDWPEPTAWRAAVAACPIVAGPNEPNQPFRLAGSLLYLDRFWQEERALETNLRRRSLLSPAQQVSQPARLDATDPAADSAQDDAVAAAVDQLTCVITGGPGTGKTTTVARIIDAFSVSPGLTQIALVAPTGKAATQLHSAVTEKLLHPERVQLSSGTLHRLLGAAPGKASPTHDSNNPLAADVIILDETSMVSLSMMNWLLAAVPDTTRLILVGDANQLTSVEAGAVLADIACSPQLVATSQAPVITLKTNHRSTPEITQLAEHIRNGEAAQCLELLAANNQLELLPFSGKEPLSNYPQLQADLLTAARAVRKAALAGDGKSAGLALDTHRLLCAHREGPFGLANWGVAAKAFLTSAADLPGYGQGQHYLGQPLLITRNSELVSNGDTAVVVNQDERLLAAVNLAEGMLYLEPALLTDKAELHAMTIHKSQGSQFDTVTVILPPVGSPLLTRQLIYTAITRAKYRLRLLGSPEALSLAVNTPIRRASGLGVLAELATDIDHR